MPTIQSLRTARLLTHDQARAATTYGNAVALCLRQSEGAVSCSLGKVSRSGAYGSDEGRVLGTLEVAADRADDRALAEELVAGARRVLAHTDTREAVDALVLRGRTGDLLSARRGLDALVDLWRGEGTPDHEEGLHALDADLDAAATARADALEVEAREDEDEERRRAKLAALMGNAGTERRKMKGVRASRRGRGVTHDRAVAHYEGRGAA